VPYANAELLASHLPNSELLRVDGAGHLALLERSEAVDDAIVRFLS
jgi:pimeloyl-ACP methyl ester carboxylesterase